MDPNIQDRFCPAPFDQLYAGANGVALHCCPGWLPSVGDLKSQNVDEVWNSPASLLIRKSILDGSFKYCKKEVCPILKHGLLPKRSELTDPVHHAILKENKVLLEFGPRVLNLSMDPSCNLSCPSCRNEKIMITSGESYEALRHLHLKVLEQSLPSLEKIIVSGNGDPLASKMYREILFTLDGSRYPLLKFELLTNGQLFHEDNWEKLSKIHRNIESIRVSLDAATAPTYRIVRQGGDFETVMENMKFLRSEKQKHGLSFALRLDFVVQQLNYREMPDFVRLAKELGADACLFQRIRNWGTYSQKDFERHDILLPSHPEHGAFRKILNDPLLDDPLVDIGNLWNFLDESN